MTLFDSLLQDSMAYLPVLSWALLGIVVLIAQTVFPCRKLSFWLSLVGIIAILALTRSAGFSASPLFSQSVVFDLLAQNLLTIGGLSLLGSLLLLAHRMNDESKILKTAYEQMPELLICLLFVGFGFGVLVTAVNMSALFLGLETLSMGLYAACGFYRSDIRSTESGFKYLMMGAFSTVLFLFGLAFLYGATGVADFASIQGVIQKGLSDSQTVLMQISMAFLVAAFAFKLSLVPFHFYAPDVYEGAPTAVTFLLTSLVKIGAMGAALRLFTETLVGVDLMWKPAIIVLSLASILIGNIMAIQQRSLKKLLTFSSISHSGFMALTLVASFNASLQPALTYLAAYTFMNLGLFAVILILEDSPKPLMIDDLKGLVNQKFFMSVVLGLFLFGLAGLPPFAGFLIKFWVLQALVENGQTAVALVAALGGVIGAAYYLRLMMVIFFSEETPGAASQSHSFSSSRLVYVVLLFGAAVTLFGGFRPQVYTDWILGVLALK